MKSSSSSNSSNEMHQVSFLSRGVDGATNALSICKYKVVSPAFIPQVPIPLHTKSGCFDMGSVPNTKKVIVGEPLLLYNTQSYKRPSLYGNNDGKAYWISSVYQVLAQILDTEVPVPKDHNFQDNELSIVIYNHHSNTFLVRTLGVLTIVRDPEAMFFGVDEENNKGLNIQIPTKFQISSLAAHKRCCISQDFDPEDNTMLALTMPMLNRFSDIEKKGSQITLQTEVYQGKELKQIKYDNLLSIDEKKRKEVRQKIVKMMKDKNVLMDNHLENCYHNLNNKSGKLPLRHLKYRKMKPKKDEPKKNENKKNGRG